MVEGATEQAVRQPLLDFLRRQLGTGMPMPKLDFVTSNGRLPKNDKLKRDVRRLRKTSDYVIALTDVYTGPPPRDFSDADDARKKMRDWVGEEPYFYPHAAQYEFEAWLLPYWTRIQDLAGVTSGPPFLNPETVNHERPPARLLQDVFRKGNKNRSYSKTRDAAAILRKQDLEISARQCPELQAFLNTILVLCGGKEI